VDWDHADADLLEFVHALSQLRRRHPVFRRRRFFQGLPTADGLRDIAWLTPAGREMSDEDWNAHHGKSIAVFLNGDAITEPDTRGERVSDDSFLLLFNAHSDPVAFTLPSERFAASWEVVLDTAAGGTATEIPALRASARVTVAGRAAQIMRRVEAQEPA